MRVMASPRMHWFWRALIRSRLSAGAYYWLLDHLTDNNGWRPLHMRYPEHFPRRGRA